MPDDTTTPALGGRVLVTGGAGFLGRHLVERLLAAGREVVVLDDLSTGSIERLPSHTRLSVSTRSVLDGPALEQAARGVGFVFHLAGVVGMRRVAQEGALAEGVGFEPT
ncbi:MAG TPA: NAD-dependent epimerase/dehydratase family protein, partial [Planctomycetota bacterium]|nr:NAD-dependent epimerase/dehydratase family protein [Planctomycetota bacterium]